MQFSNDFEKKRPKMSFESPEIIAETLINDKEFIAAQPELAQVKIDAPIYSSDWLLSEPMRAGVIFKLFLET